METSEIMKEYTALEGAKSGFFTADGKFVYLYNNVCCEGVCRRILLKSKSDEILAEYADDLFVWRCGAALRVYRNSRRLLGVGELIALYEIPLESDPLYGVFVGGTEFTLGDSHFTDGRIAELIDRLLVGGRGADTVVKDEFRALAEAVRNGEVGALNEVYLKYGGAL
ncbi:MAG: hypothetical protein NC299_04055 [Lachnospiraceae bacterium]|nr:hypothetical protein [Ruminococcus sp.]MCM1274521.1 hypothetical protein [Lachnospiraceae bacterium]